MSSDKALKRQLKLKKLDQMIGKYKKLRVEFPDAEDRRVLRDRINWLEVEKLDIETEDIHDDNGIWCEIKEKSFEPVIKEVKTKPVKIKEEEIEDMEMVPNDVMP